MAKQQWGYETREFGGKRYRIGTWHDTKGAAQKRADMLRGKGYNVRVAKRTYGGRKSYVIYANPDPFKQ